MSIDRVIPHITISCWTDSIDDIDTIMYLFKSSLFQSWRAERKKNVPPPKKNRKKNNKTQDPWPLKMSEDYLYTSIVAQQYRDEKKTFKTKLCAENGSVTSMKQLSQYF